MDPESLVLISISTVGGRHVGPHLEYSPHRKLSLTNALERVRQETDELVREVRLATDKPSFEQ